MRKALPLLALAALAGCGGYRSVRVKHKLPGAEAASSPALGAVYLVIKAPSAPGNQEVTALAGALLGKAGAEINYQALARRVSMVMKKEGAHLCAWRVEKGTGEVSDFADRLNPTGLVVLSLGAPSVSVTKQERTAVQYDKKNQKQTVRNKVWAYSASLPAEVQLLSWPEKKPLDSWTYAFEISEDRFDKSKAEEDWYSDSEGRLYSEVADKLAGRYAARTVERWRPLFSVAKDTGSEKAAELGGEGRWEEASAIWQSRLPAGGWALFTDTVGFIQKLPHDLIAAFRATLEEIRYSDLILHVHDLSSPEARAQHEAVKATLGELGIKDIPVLNVFNKADAVKDHRMSAWAPERLRPLFTSALTGAGVPELLAACERALASRWGEYELLVPAGSKGLIKEIYSCCLVKNADYGQAGVTLSFKATPENYARLRKKLPQP